MTQTNGFGVIILLVAAGLVIAGLITGQMPGTIGSAEPRRQENPLGFWLLGALYCAVALVGAFLAVKNVQW